MIDPQTHPIPYTPELPDVAAYLYAPRYRAAVPKRFHELDESAQLYARWSWSPVRDGLEGLLRRVDAAIEVVSG